MKAFMRGLHHTAALAFGHSGLGTTAVHAGDTLIIQNDIGTTDAHVLVVHVKPTDEIEDTMDAEPRGAARGEALTGITQGILQEFLTFGRTEGLIQPHAVTNSPRRGTINGIENQIGTAQRKKGAMPEIMLRCPREQIDCSVLANECLEGSARLVPIDQKNNA
jgi:hypothetical protein